MPILEQLNSMKKYWERSKITQTLAGHACDMYLSCLDYLMACYEGLGQTEHALACCDQILSFDRSLPEGLYNKGRNLLLAEKAYEALPYFQAALRFQQDSDTGRQIEESLRPEADTDLRPRRRRCLSVPRGFAAGHLPASALAAGISRHCRRDAAWACPKRLQRRMRRLIALFCLSPDPTDKAVFAEANTELGDLLMEKYLDTSRPQEMLYTNAVVLHKVRFTAALAPSGGT